MLRLLRGAFYTLLLALVCLVVAAVTDTPGAPPALLLDAHPLLRLPLEGAWTVLDWAWHYPKVAAVIVGLVVVPTFLASLIARLPRRIEKDPQRLYTRDERRAAAEMAGGRCEGEWLPFLRCRGGAEQGDHWFPHSLGGATDMQNLVSLCAPCNRAKSNHVPTFWQTLRLTMRRRKYFPAHLDPKPGSKYGQRVH